MLLEVAVTLHSSYILGFFGGSPLLYAASGLPVRHEDGGHRETATGQICSPGTQSALKTEMWARTCMWPLQPGECGRSGLPAPAGERQRGTLTDSGSHGVHTCSSFTLKLRAVRSADRHAKFLATWCFGASDGNETTPPPFNGREPSRHLPLSAARVRGWMGPGGSVCSLRPRQRQPGGLTRGLGASETPLIRACAWWSHMSMASLTWSWEGR